MHTHVKKMTLQATQLQGLGVTQMAITHWKTIFTGILKTND